METGVGRRVFVGSVVAGLPLLAASAARTFAQSGAEAAHAHSGIVDPVVDHIIRQLASAHNMMRRDARGEHLRAFAAQLRTLAVYGRQTGVDERVVSGLRARFERDGRDALLYPKVDRDRVLAELQSYGARPDDRIVRAESDLDYGRRSAVLESVLTAGAFARCDRIASLLERASVEFDQRVGSIVRVSRQSDADYWQGFCAELWSQYREDQFLAGLFCASAALPVIGVGFAPLCISWQLAATILAMAYAVYCWNV